MKKFIVLGLLAVLVLVVVALSRTERRKVAGVADSSIYSQRTPASKAEAQTNSVVAQIPAHYHAVPNLDSLAPTMAPEVFAGNPRLAYQVAKEIPQTLAQIPCYCHCDRSKGHQSLHSCFESEHGENCGICIGEALLAYRLEKREGLKPREIRERIIAAYGSTQND